MQRQPACTDRSISKQIEAHRSISKHIEAYENISKHIDTDINIDVEIDIQLDVDIWKIEKDIYIHIAIEAYRSV